MNPFSDSPLLVSEKWLELPLKETHSALSWAIVGGGWISIEKVYWIRVNNSDLGPNIIPEEFYRNRLAEKGEREEVLGFMTSASLLDHSVVIRSKEEFHVRCISTVGLGNSVRVGDLPTPSPKIGTINVLVQTSESLTLSASLEAVSIATEARTLAVLEAEIQSKAGEGLATGTGTDCIGILSPTRSNAIDYVGKHTIFGHLIGTAVFQSVQAGIRSWKHGRSTFTNHNALGRTFL
ncbi:cobalamin biosynthesis protein [Leptospira langatensis]|uniref:Cobalamin biosynthesis protein n=1 Tax=Leptospira langatensis TaxID=2484983 RepID=A0A5F1ZWL9_9LEPT|nr:adenosylcobinamide amidohydrolase [Leptospira langatensis]TGJ98426.1 cobalamin biosynthesis protein [Leptospira langatensis]TGL43341.1 cobalamin biosynthesis protein [Leptospira langatensis]